MKNKAKFSGAGAFAARKADLMTKLLTRHKRIKKIDAHPYQADDAGYCSSGSSHGRSTVAPRSPVAPATKKKTSVVKNIVTRGLRRKREEAAKTPIHMASSRTQVRPVPLRTTDLPLSMIVLTPEAASMPPILVDDDSTSSDTSSPERPVLSFVTSPGKTAKRSASFTPHPHPMYQDDDMHYVIESVLANDLKADPEHNDDDYDKPGSYRNHHTNPTGKYWNWVVVTAMVAVGICVMSIFLMNFAILPTIASLVAIALSMTVVAQDRSLNSFHQYQRTNHDVVCELEVWSMANSHLRTRVLAANTVLLRGHSIKVTLDEMIREKSSRGKSVEKVKSRSSFRRSSRKLQAAAAAADALPPTPLSAGQVVNIHKQLAANIKQIEQQKRNEVLLIVSKALSVSNRQQRSLLQQETVLNSLGVEVIISRLQKMEGIDFEPDDFHQLMEQYGHTKEAVHTLYQLIMNKDSQFIRYNVLSRQTMGNKKS